MSRINKFTNNNLAFARLLLFLDLYLKPYKLFELGSILEGYVKRQLPNELPWRIEAVPNFV